MLCSQVINDLDSELNIRQHPDMLEEWIEQCDITLVLNENRILFQYCDLLFTLYRWRMFQFTFIENLFSTS